jgi:flagellar protein FlbD
MIQLTRLNHLPLVLNSDLIEYIEITPDTVITLTTGQKIMVGESAVEVVDRVVAFRLHPEHRGGVSHPEPRSAGGCVARIGAGLSLWPISPPHSGQSL